MKTENRGRRVMPNKKLIGDMVTVKWGAGKLGQLDYGLSHEQAESL